MNYLKNMKLDNKETFASLIESIENDLYNIAKHKFDNINDIDDVIQETVIKIYENINNLENEESFKSWAIKILLNECNNYYRKKHKDFLLLEKMVNIDSSQVTDNSISNVEEELYFKELLKSLPSIDQNIFIFYYQCNYSIKEIASILNLNENTVKSRLKRNKEKLEKKMKGGND